MRKFITALIITIIPISLIGCGQVDDNSRIMDEAKVAFASKEYEKAEGILKLAMDEKKDKEAEGLYNQVKAFREINDRISSMNLASSLGNLRRDTAVDGLFYILDNLKIIEENKTKSELVINELTKYVDEVKVSITELIGVYREYIYEADIKNAEEYLEYINKIKSYNLDCLKDYEFEIDKYEEALNKLKNDREDSTREYNREEAYKLAKEKMGLVGIRDSMGDEPEPNKVIGDEECYFANIEFTVNDISRVDQVYIGSKTLNVYSYTGEFRMNLKYDI